VPNYDKVQFDKLKKLRDRLLDECEICHGRGYSLNGSDDEACRCMVVFKYIKQLMNADIASPYWKLKLEQLEIREVYKTLIGEYCNNLENAKDKSLGFLFEGPNGVGKTACLAEIGKQGIVRGYRVLYLTAERYIAEISNMRRDAASLTAHELYQQKIEKADILLFDELDKAYIREDSSFVPKKIEDFVRSSISQHKIVCIATNMDTPALTEVFGDSFISMLQRHLKFVPFTGNDISPKLQKDWTTELRTRFDYYCPAILEAAFKRKELCDVDY